MAESRDPSEGSQTIRINGDIQPTHRPSSAGEKDASTAETPGVRSIQDEEWARNITNQDILGTRKQVC